MNHTDGKLATEALSNSGDAARTWWESNGNKGELRDITREDLNRILEASGKWYATARKEGEAAKLAGVNLDKEELWGALLGAVLADADLQWANLDQAKLEGANLWGAQLRGAMPIRASFDWDEGSNGGQAGPDLSRAAYSIEAELQGAKLAGTIVERPEPAAHGSSALHHLVADLTAADLQDAHLRDGRLASVTGLPAESLRGADLTNAKLPPDIAKFDALTQVEKISQNAGTTFFGLLGACLYSWLTIATTTDVALITDRTSTPLPIISTQISLPWVYLAAPLIVLSAYLYLQLYLQRLWQGLSTLPAVFPDGKALDEKSYPWLLNGLVRAHFFRLALDQRPLSSLENYLTIFLAWWVVPLTLIAFWLRYLPRHDWWGTTWLVVFIAIATGFGVYSYRLAVRTLSGVRHHGHAYRLDRWTLIVSLLTLFLSINAGINPVGSQSWRPSQWDWWPDPPGIRAGVAGYLSLLPWYRTSADLRDAEVSTKPANWTARKESLETEITQVKGADLRDQDLRAAVANDAFLVKARLVGADLRGASLRRADLQEAILSGANLGDADLREADLKGANLFETDLRGANLQDAKNLSQQQLNTACANEETKLPKGYTIKPCVSTR